MSEKRVIRKKRRRRLYINYVVFTIIFLIGALDIGCYYYNAYQSKKEAQSLANEVLIWEDENVEIEEVGNSDRGSYTDNALPSSSSATEPEELKEVVIPQAINFNALLSQNKDVVAWIYCPNTAINYPIVQGDDNDTYLNVNFRLEQSRGGTLFVECTNAADFSDRNTIIYGHNMKNGAMFHTITKYKNQSFYEEHPLMYLYTPQKRYEIRVLAGCVVNPDADIYTRMDNSEVLKQDLEEICRSSNFVSKETWQETEQLVTLSTCSYEYDDARYVLIGKLVEW